MALSDSLQSAITAHAPSMGIACSVSSEGDDPNRVSVETSFGLAMQGTTPQQAIAALAAIKATYLHVCRMFAEQNKVEESQLQRVIDDHIAKSGPMTARVRPGGGP